VQSARNVYVETPCLFTSLRTRFIPEIPEYVRKYNEIDVKLKLSLCLTKYDAVKTYEDVSKSFRTESITKYNLTTMNAR